MAIADIRSTPHLFAPPTQGEAELEGARRRLAGGDGLFPGRVFRSMAGAGDTSAADADTTLRPYRLTFQHYLEFLQRQGCAPRPSDLFTVFRAHDRLRVGSVSFADLAAALLPAGITGSIDTPWPADGTAGSSAPEQREVASLLMREVALAARATVVAEALATVPQVRPRPRPVRDSWHGLSACVGACVWYAAGPIRALWAVRRRPRRTAPHGGPARGERWRWRWRRRPRPVPTVRAGAEAVRLLVARGR